MRGILGQRTDAVNSLQELALSRRALRPARSAKCRQLLELAHQHRGLKLRDPVVAAGHALPELVRLAGTAAVHDRLDKLEAVEPRGENHAAFTGGHELRSLEAECSQVAHRTRAFAQKRSAVCVGAVFHHNQPVLGRQGAQPRHIGEAHREMHGDNRFRPRRNCCPRGFHRKTIGVGLHVGEDGDAARIENCGGRAVPGVRGNNHFVAEAVCRRRAARW